MSDLERNRLRLAAQVFLSWGFIPIPLHGKVPLGNEWQKTDPDRALDLINRYVSRLDNLGILTGEPSNVVVVDVDVKQKGLETWETLVTRNGRPDTLTVRTGSGGLHVYFLHTETIAPLINQTGYGIEFKTTGGMVVAPWSLHPNTGKPYVMENYNLGRRIAGATTFPDSVVKTYGLPQPDDILKLENEAPLIDEMPDWLYAYLRNRDALNEEELEDEDVGEPDIVEVDASEDDD